RAVPESSTTGGSSPASAETSSSGASIRTGERLRRDPCDAGSSSLRGSKEEGRPICLGPRDLHLPILSRRQAHPTPFGKALRLRPAESAQSPEERVSALGS